jgi:uncharacterized protein
MHEISSSKQKFIFSLIGVVAVAAIVLTSLWVVSTKNQNIDRFSVSASGSIYAKPDIANIQIGFQTAPEKTPADATEEATEKINNIIGELKKLDIEAKDIKTSNYNLYPEYTYRDGLKNLKGYIVSQNISIKIRDLETIGEAIAKTTEQGANQIGSINFTIDDEYELKNEARELAIEKAKEKAGIISDQTGMKLGRVVNVYETQNTYYPDPMRYSNAKMMYSDESMAMGGIDAPSIEAGQNEVRVEVTMTYEIK